MAKNKKHNIDCANPNDRGRKFGEIAQGINLDVYVNDTDPQVRKSVASQYYGLDILKNDTNKEIREFVSYLIDFANSFDIDEIYQNYTSMQALGFNEKVIVDALLSRYFDDEHLNESKYHDISSNPLMRFVLEKGAERSLYTLKEIPMNEKMRAKKREVSLTQQKLLGKHSFIKTLSSNPSNVYIEDMILSVRTYNSLRRARIKTVQDLLSLTDFSSDKPFAQFQKIRNIGIFSSEEIADFLISYVVQHQLQNQPIEECDFSVEAYNYLKSNGYNTVRDLLANVDTSLDNPYGFLDRDRTLGWKSAKEEVINLLEPYVKAFQEKEEPKHPSFNEIVQAAETKATNQSSTINTLNRETENER